MKRASTVAILVAAGGLLAACGQKGPLFVPGVPKEASWPYPPSPQKPQPERKLPDVPGTSDERK
jgi:predicted small lipoprotein YifL